MTAKISLEISESKRLHDKVIHLPGNDLLIFPPPSPSSFLCYLMSLHFH